MNKSKSIILILISILIFEIVFTSCNQSKYKNEVNIIDSLMVSLDSSEIKLTSMDTSYANAKWDSIKVKINFLKDYYEARKDTVNKKESFLVSDYYSLRKPFRTFTPEYKKATKELKFTKDQLTALKQDLSNNILKDELAKKHFLAEQSAAKEVIVMVDKLQASIGLNSKKLEIVEPKIDSLIAEIKKSQLIK